MQTFKFEVEGNVEEYNFARVAKQANGSVWLQEGNTVILAAVTMDDEISEEDFLPLTVQYIEKAYAVGKIPGGYIKREAKPGEFETLTSRLIDRALRPNFPKGFSNPVQITINVLSADENSDLQLLALKAASSALYVSDIPVNNYISAIRIAKIENEIVVNPKNKDLINESSLDIFIAGNKEDITMIEMRAICSIKMDSSPPIIADPMIDPSIVAEMLKIQETNALDENDLINILELSSKRLEEFNKCYEDSFKDIVKKPRKIKLISNLLDENMLEYVRDNYEDLIKEVIKKLAKSESNFEKIKIIKKMMEDETVKKNNWEEKDLLKTFDLLKREIIRKMIIEDNIRADGRDLKSIRPIHIETNVLPNAHGSCLFKRGETEALAVLTIGSLNDAQMYENLTDSSSKTENFIFHYNFPGFSVGEVTKLGPPNRRELGHANLAKRAIEPTLINKDSKTIRIVSEILSSNGSSSMATVCASSLALKSGAVETNDLVAGIAMGLIKEDENFAILTDIMGLEDHDGDMDFKIAGTKDGITALQMDIKVKGLDIKILKEALIQAKEAKLKILNLMKGANDEIIVNEDLIPDTEIFSVDPKKIVSIIGKAGKTIKEIIHKFEVKIDLEKDSGNIKISGKRNNINAAKEHIKNITKKENDDMQLEIGKLYQGKVKRVVEFGAFVEFENNKDGLLHISKLADYRVEKVTDIVNVGDIVEVEVLAIKGHKIELALKRVIESQ